ncbi:Beta/Gamma crystallin-domain-containing protein [Neurospora tetraspora]|uniref:Beta/Gamma crystallin-domain-containing protein n=1 Tax=Neurospora tetraspora TaxID=94610 RepID=A0AAE0MU46_9PEZI|nr:Beta/Gamma crystallin-domain-containing protein [Neurospora tetraspora]
MAPSVDPSTVVFYQKKNFEGSGDTYAVGQDVSVPGSLNDKYLSVAVGASAKVIAWQHYNESGHYREWTDSQADISDIGGLSRFKVVDDDTRAISFLFKDATGGDEKQYSLKVDARDVGTVMLYSTTKDGGEYGLVGILPAGGPPVTTAIYVRDEHSGGYLCVGSVFFQWNEESKGVDVVENENWPKQLEQKRTGKSSFEVTLVDNKPSE